MNVGDMPKELEPEGNEEVARREMGDLMNHKEVRIFYSRGILK